jgi:ABC-type Fe3+/spermidine/putrescine transport system ATPase subunit
VAFLRVSSLRRRIGGVDALAGADLEVGPGELACLVGPSGAGKTTLLRVLAGAQPPDLGKVLLDGRDLLSLAPARRGVALVAQGVAALPHLTALASVAGDTPAAPALALAREALAVAGATDLADRLGAELSGGMQQRVSLARALAGQPRLLLLDEPLSQIDAPARAEVWARLRPFLRERGVTTLLVTHDVPEALGWADRLAVLRQGRVVQSGRPADLYRRPADSWVAGFLGQANLIPGSVVRVGAGEAVVATALGEVSGALARPESPPAEGADVVLCLRPESLRIDAHPPEFNAFAGRVIDSLFQGELTRHRFQTAAGPILRVTEPNARSRGAAPAFAWIEPEDVVVLPS